MKRPNPCSLRRRILIFVTSATLLLVGIFSVLLTQYFAWGMENGLRIHLKSEASEYQRHWQDVGLPPADDDPRHWVTTERKALPEPFRQRAMAEHPEHDDLSVFTNEPAESAGVCLLDRCVYYYLYRFQLDNGSWLYLYGRTHPQDFSNSGLTDFHLSLILIVVLIAVVITGMLIGVYRLLSQVSDPIAQIAGWAGELSVDAIEQSVPAVLCAQILFAMHFSTLPQARSMLYSGETA